MTDTAHPVGHRAPMSPGTGLEIGDVLNASFRIFGRRFMPLIVMMAVVFGVSYGAVFLLKEQMISSGIRGPQASYTVQGVRQVLELLAALIGQSAGVVAVVKDLRNEASSFGSALGVAIARFPVVFGIALLSTLIILVGFILLVVPGMIAQIALSVAVPACMVERLGVIASLRRSQVLTQGQRWRILGLFTIFSIAAIIILLGASAIAGEIGTFVLQVLTESFSAVLVAVVYYRLRILKDGIDISAIANVFD